MAVLKDGSPPIAFCKIGRDGTEYSVSIVQIADDGTEMPIWDAAQDGKLHVVFKSYDGRITYSSAWYQSGATIAKPTAPTREPSFSGETKTVYTFAGWSTSMNSTSGTTGAITAGGRSMTYYAAFEATVVEPLYLVKNGTVLVAPTVHVYSKLNQSTSYIEREGNSLIWSNTVNGVITWDGLDYSKYAKVHVSYSFTNVYSNQRCGFFSSFDLYSSVAGYYISTTNNSSGTYSGDIAVPADTSYRFGFGDQGGNSHGCRVTLDEVVLLPE